MFCIVGVFFVNNIMFDVWIMFGLGLLGYFLMENDFFFGFLILVFIFGLIIESNFMCFIFKLDGDFMVFIDCFIVMVLVIFVVLVWILIIVNGFLKFKDKNGFIGELFRVLNVVNGK